VLKFCRSLWGCQRFPVPQSYSRCESSPDYEARLDYAKSETSNDYQQHGGVPPDLHFGIFGASFRDCCLYEKYGAP